MFLPFALLKFWYIDAPLEMLKLFRSINNYYMQLFALPLCLKTFFKPLKNEYRQGLVGFSRGMGMVIKSFFIMADLIILFFLLLFEFIFIVSFLSFPATTVVLLFL
jgi:hypothetical protein